MIYVVLVLFQYNKHTLTRVTAYFLTNDLNRYKETYLEGFLQVCTCCSSRLLSFMQPVHVKCLRKGVSFFFSMKRILHLKHHFLSFYCTMEYWSDHDLIKSVLFVYILQHEWRFQQGLKLLVTMRRL